MRRWPRIHGPNPDRPPGAEFFIRACGDTLCSCGLDYYRHPYDVQELTYQDEPYLRVLCDGTRVKL